MTKAEWFAEGERRFGKYRVEPASSKKRAAHYRIRSNRALTGWRSVYRAFAEMEQVKRDWRFESYVPDPLGQESDTGDTEGDRKEPGAGIYRRHGGHC